MEATITLTLPNEISEAVEEATRREGVSPNEIINEAIKDYVFVRQFRLLRERMIPKAREQGIFTDEDVLDRVS